MVFSSVIFIFGFLPITLLLYKFSTLIHKTSIQNFVLFLCSLIFYAWGGIQYLIFMIILIIINYYSGMIISRTTNKKQVLIVAIIIDLGVLVICKYFNFLVNNIEYFLHIVGITSVSFEFPNIPLPIGISFFTFRIISYLIDLYRGNVKVERNILKMGLYVMMFPQMIAGPIVRYSDIAEEIDHRESSSALEEKGIKRFILGFSKKVLLVSAVGQFADVAFNYNGSLNFIWAWFGAICYALQIYIDFSAYSDMAIGLGWIFGFHFNENFNYPYISTSIQEFWRRWHISLSTWFRDYVYFPLGGNRCSKFKTYRNLIIVFLLTGLWHGAAWQYIFWGLYHGFFLIVERMGLNKLLKQVPSLFRHLYVIVIVTIGWVFFRADNISKALIYLKNMFTFNLNGIKDLTILTQFSGNFILFLVISLFISMPVYQKVVDFNLIKNNLIKNIIYICLFIISVVFMIGSSYNPFIYSKF